MRGEPISQLSLCNQQITGTVSISLDLGKQARGRIMLGIVVTE